MAFPASTLPSTGHTLNPTASSSRTSEIPHPGQTVHKVAQSRALGRSHFTLGAGLIAPLPPARGPVHRTRPAESTRYEPDEEDDNAPGPSGSSTVLSAAGQVQAPVAAPIAIPGPRGRSRRIKPIRSSDASVSLDSDEASSRSTTWGSTERERVRLRGLEGERERERETDRGTVVVVQPVEEPIRSGAEREAAVAQALDDALHAEVLRQLLPIMGRLPADSSPSSSTAPPPSELAEDDGVSTYLRSAPASSDPPVLYTRARLPRLDEHSRELWKAMHGFRPVVRDYAEGFVPTASSSVAVRPSAALPADHPPVPLASASTTDPATTCPFATSSAQHVAALESVRRAFNWSDLALPTRTVGEWYGVVFRSVKRSPASASPSDLADLQARWDALYAADALAHEEAVQAGGLMMYWYGAPSVRTGANLATCVWTSREDALSASALPLHKKAVRLASGAYETYELARYRVVKREGETRVRLENW